MSTAAIAIDNWKVSTFEKVLTEAGYKFKKKKGTGIYNKCVFLSVESDDMVKLHEVIKKAQNEAAKAKTN